MPPFLPLAAVSWVVSFQEGDKPTFGVAAGAKLSLAIPHGHGSTEPCKGISCAQLAHFSSSSSAFASLRSGVAKPSVNQP